MKINQSLALPLIRTSFRAIVEGIPAFRITCNQLSRSFKCNLQISISTIVNLSLRVPTFYMHAPTRHSSGINILYACTIPIDLNHSNSVSISFCLSVSLSLRVEGLNKQIYAQCYYHKITIQVELLIPSNCFVYSD